MGESDLYFGYGISDLREVSDGGGYATHVPSATVYYTQEQQRQQDTETGEQQETGPPPETPDPDADANNARIEDVQTQIMGEQPGTTFDRAGEWSNIASMLFYVKSDLYRQTTGLEADWDSPKAKDAFLHKVGMTLAYAQVWREAAQDNADALNHLGAEMYNAQAKMRALWSEYQRELGGVAQHYAERAGGRHGNPSPEQVADMKENLKQYTDSPHLPLMRKVKERYDQKARVLASETANAYAPAITKLQAGRAKMLDPLNAVVHPAAFGAPVPAAAPAAPGATGAPGFGGRLAIAPGGGASPPGAPAGPATTPPAAPSAPAPSPTALSTPAPPSGFGTPVPPTVGAPAAPPAPVPPAAPLAPAAPAAPVALVPTTATPPAWRGAPGIGTGSPTAAPQAPPAGASTPPGIAARGGLTGNGTGSPALPAAPRGLSQAPGTITPPPAGGMQAKPPQQGKVLGNRPGSPGLPGGTPAVPPGGSTSAGRPADPAADLPAALLRSETPEEFRPPPAATPSVLGTNRPARRRRETGPPDAAATVSTAAHGAVPPLLANPRLSEQNRREEAPRPASAPYPTDRTPSEFAARVPASAAPVLQGPAARNPATDEFAGEVPHALRGTVASPAADGPSEAAPRLQADRAVRQIDQGGQPSQPTADQAAWEVQSPGGPVVASGQRGQAYRAEPSPTLDARS